MTGNNRVILQGEFIVFIVGPLTVGAKKLLRENFLEVNMPNVVLQRANEICGNVADFFSKNDSLEPSKAFHQKYPSIASNVVEQLQAAAKDGVVYTESQQLNGRVLPPALRQFLEREFPGRGLLPKSDEREPLIQFVQSKLNGPGGQPLAEDGRLGIDTARALIERFREQGFFKPSPCFK